MPITLTKKAESPVKLAVFHVVTERVTFPTWYTQLGRLRAPYLALSPLENKPLLPSCRGGWHDADEGGSRGLRPLPRQQHSGSAPNAEVNVWVLRSRPPNAVFPMGYMEVIKYRKG